MAPCQTSSGIRFDGTAVEIYSTVLRVCTVCTDSSGTGCSETAVSVPGRSRGRRRRDRFGPPGPSVRGVRRGTSVSVVVKERFDVVESLEAIAAGG